MYVAEWDTDGKFLIELRVGAVLENFRAPDLLIIPKNDGLPDEGETIRPCEQHMCSRSACAGYIKVRGPSALD